MCINAPCISCTKIACRQTVLTVSLSVNLMTRQETDSCPGESSRDTPCWKMTSNNVLQRVNMSAISCRFALACCSLEIRDLKPSKTATMAPPPTIVFGIDILWQAACNHGAPNCAMKTVSTWRTRDIQRNNTRKTVNTAHQFHACRYHAQVLQQNAHSFAKLP